MATISTASIQTGLTVEAEHVTRIINALDGVASNNIIINADLKQGSTSNSTNNSNSHAEGDGTTASGNYSHAEGKGTTASSDSAHAEGIDTTAAGQYSHAEGEQTVANGRSSHAEGYYTIASANYQTAVGRYNTDSNTTDYFVVGVGSAGGRLDGLGVNNTRTYISNSLYLPDLTNTAQTYVLTYDTTTKQVFYLTGSAFGGSGGGPGTPGGTNKTIQFNSGSTFSGSGKFTFDYTTDKVFLTGSMAISGSGNEILTIRGSGSSQPITTVIGSQGTLLSVTDSLSGSLFSVTDISGQSMMEVFSDNTIIIGTSGTNNPSSLYVTKKLITAASGQFALGLGLILTSSYDGAYFEYIAKSGSNARSGYITATWSGSSIVSSSITSSNIGDTSGLTTFAAISSSYIVLSGSANAANWTVKSIIRAI